MVVMAAAAEEKPDDAAWPACDQEGQKQVSHGLLPLGGGEGIVGGATIHSTP
jgi:hypothetical protein